MSILNKNYNADITIFEKSGVYYGLNRDGVQLYRDSDLATVINGGFTELTSGGYLLMALNGNHTVTESIDPGNNVAIRLEGMVKGDVERNTGTILVADDALTDPVINIDGATFSTHFKLANFAIDGNRANTTCKGIYLAEPVRCVLEDIQIRYTGDYGLHTGTGGGSRGFYNWYNRIEILDSNTHGCYCTNQDEYEFSSCWFASNGDTTNGAAGLWILLGQGRVRNSWFVEENERGLRIHEAGENVSIEGCVFDKIDEEAIYIESGGVSGIHILGNYFLDGSYASTGVSSSILADDATYCVVANNWWRSPNTTPDHCIETLATSDYWLVTGNDMRANANGATSLNGANNTETDNWA